MAKELMLNFHFDPIGVLYIAIERPRAAVCGFTDEDVAVRFNDAGEIVGWTIDFATQPLEVFLPLEGDLEREDLAMTSNTPGLWLTFDPKTQWATVAWARGGRATSPALSSFHVKNDTLTRLKPAA